MIRKWREWRARRRFVRHSKIQVFASRTTTLPLEHCNAENLRTAARYDRRKARLYAEKRHKQGKAASFEWYTMAADALESLADSLKDGQTVGTIPYRKRRKHMETLLRLTEGKAA